MDKDNKEVNQAGAKLRQMREALQLSQEQFSKVSGLTQSTISALENNKIPLTSHYIDKLWAPLRVQRADLEQLIGVINLEGLDEQQRRMVAIATEFPEMPGLLARVMELPPRARSRFRRMMRHFIEMEEADQADDRSLVAAEEQ